MISFDVNNLDEFPPLGNQNQIEFPDLPYLDSLIKQAKKNNNRKEWDMLVQYAEPIQNIIESSKIYPLNISQVLQLEGKIIRIIGFNIWNQNLQLKFFKGQIRASLTDEEIYSNITEWNTHIYEALSCFERKHVEYLIKQKDPKFYFCFSEQYLTSQLTDFFLDQSIESDKFNTKQIQKARDQVLSSKLMIKKLVKLIPKFGNWNRYGIGLFSNIRKLLNKYLRANKEERNFYLKNIDTTFSDKIEKWEFFSLVSEIVNQLIDTICEVSFPKAFVLKNQINSDMVKLIYSLYELKVPENTMYMANISKTLEKFDYEKTMVEFKKEKKDKTELIQVNYYIQTLGKIPPNRIYNHNQLIKMFKIFPDFYKLFDPKSKDYKPNDTTGIKTVLGIESIDDFTEEMWGALCTSNGNLLKKVPENMREQIINKYPVYTSSVCWSCYRRKQCYKYRGTCMSTLYEYLFECLDCGNRFDQMRKNPEGIYGCLHCYHGVEY